MRLSKKTLSHRAIIREITKFLLYHAHQKNYDCSVKFIKGILYEGKGDAAVIIAIVGLK